MKFQAKLSSFVIATHFSLLKGTPAPPPGALTAGGGASAETKTPPLTEIKLVDVDAMTAMADMIP
jgi:hypothetical protein